MGKRLEDQRLRLRLQTQRTDEPAQRQTANDDVCGTQGLAISPARRRGGNASESRLQISKSSAMQRTTDLQLNSPVSSPNGFHGAGKANHTLDPSHTRAGSAASVQWAALVFPNPIIRLPALRQNEYYLPAAGHYHLFSLPFKVLELRTPLTPFVRPPALSRCVIPSICCLAFTTLAHLERIKDCCRYFPIPRLHTSTLYTRSHRPESTEKEPPLTLHPNAIIKLQNPRRLPSAGTDPYLSSHYLGPFTPSDRQKVTAYFQPGLIPTVKTSRAGSKTPPKSSYDTICGYAVSKSSVIDTLPHASCQSKPAPTSISNTIGRRIQALILSTTSSMNVVQSTHQFADAATARIQGLRRQKPENAKVAVGKEKDRKPVDPPPIIQLKISPASDPNQNYLQSPYFFMSCSLVGPSEGTLPQGPLGTALAGTLVSSLHRLKDTDNSDGAFFVFGDLSIKLEGTFRLQFNLYEMRDKECFHIQSIQSDPFTCHPQKHFPGMSESTFLTRSFSDQGVRLRLRKEPRTLLRKRGPASDDYEPRTYQKNPRQQSQSQGDRPASATQDPSRQNQGETMQLPIHSHPFDQQRPQTGGHYSHQSTASIIGSYNSDEGPNKRPRTGSEHSSYSQQHTLDSPGYPRGMYNDPQYANPFAGPGQQPPYTFPYAQSPSTDSMSSRDQYFPRPLNTQPGNSPIYDPNSQRSPQSSFFPGQPQTMRYQHPTLAPSPTQRIHNPANTFEGLGIGTRTQMPGMQAPGMTGMAPPTQYGRTNTSPTYGSLSSSGSRRDMYTEYSSPNQGVSAVTMGGGLMATRAPSAVSTTSAPGSLEGAF
ncbi:hypothetical protein G7Y89_g13435 [Cudoniella acicularis]|uniref:Velvet domain-containing protein n=1 Tax=Cudoniella acicularis TaxID=354080 RepID=A0A8H4VYP7_9HELO|nr:hypothetical protein G7Y89_g13435 [Cudoniella acicularis]